MSQRILSPWPAPTPTQSTVPSEPSTSALPKEEHGDVHAARSLKRRKFTYDSHRATYLQRRQSNESPDWDAIAAAQDECAAAGNGVVSCYPTSDTTFTQNSWVTFVWNSKQPSYAQTDSVNIYLFRAESLEQMYVFRDVQNPLYGTPGVLRTQINDTWWTNEWSGGEDTYSYYFQIKRSDQELDGSDVTQSRFNAVQTTYANSVLASMSSASAAATATSSSAPSSITATSGSPTDSGAVVTTTDSNGDPITYTTNSDGAPTDSNGSTLSTDSNGVPTNTGSVQANDPGEGGFPNWAIALITVLGVLAIVLGCVLAFLIGRRLRKRRELESQRNSMGSSTPMMANVDNAASPMMSPTSGNHAALAGAAGAAGVGAAAGYSADRHSSLGHDGASSISAGDNGPFSGADAAIMADAFRKALRKPDFAGRPVEEGDSPDHEDLNDRNTPTPVPSGMLSRELAEEGRDIRSVSSSRGVRIEGSEDGASTIHHDY